MTVIEMSKPYIDVVSYIEKGNEKVEIIWRVNGCYTLNEARVIINDESKDVLSSNTTGFCNYLDNREGSQSVFTVEVGINDNVRFEAVVD